MSVSPPTLLPARSRPGMTCLTCLTGLISSALISAIIGWLISQLYPLLNVAIVDIVESVGLPEESSSLMWMGIAFVCGLVISVLFNLISRLIVKR